MILRGTEKDFDVTLAAVDFSRVQPWLCSTEHTGFSLDVVMLFDTIWMSKIQWNSKESVWSFPLLKL